MESRRARELHPACLPPGTVVGPWRVVGWRGRGTYGAVYRAERVGQEGAGLVALKVAVHAEDPRFAREAALLSRIHHPGVPELLGHGQWRNGERVHPYLAMQWVEGLPLYEWAAARNPCSRELMELLAQMGRSLAAVHAAGVVHRDVKGDNFLVRVEDGRVFLVDLGSGYSGHQEGAARLTWGPLPPNTPGYRSPEAWRFAYEHRRTRQVHYEAQPADDVFALGVTAYRLVTDEYPPSTEPGEDEAGIWHMGGPGPRPPIELNPRLDSSLSALIYRMLAVRPESRGTAEELADWLEQELECAEPEAELPVFAWEKLPPSAWSREEEAAASELGHRPCHRVRAVVEAAEQQDRAARPKTARREAEQPARVTAPTGSVLPRLFKCLEWVPRLAAVVVCAAFMGFVAWKAAHWQPEEGAAVAQVEARDGGSEDGGTSGVGQEALSSRIESSEAGPAKERPGLRLEVPKGPLPGQRRPDNTGRCRRPEEVAINGGCWWQITGGKPPCDEGCYEWQGACYFPVRETSRPPTSDSP